MAISQVDIIKMNEFLQGQVNGYYDVIPASTKMDLTELLEVLIKLFRNGLKSGRKDIYLLNTLVAINSIIDELSDSEFGVDFTLANETKKLKEEYLKYAEKKGSKNDQIYNLVDLMSQYIYVDDTIYGEDEESTPESSENNLEENEEPVKNTEETLKTLNQENEELKNQIAELRKELYAANKSEKNLQNRLGEAERRVNALKNEKKSFEKKATRLENSLNQANHVADKNAKKLEESEKENKSIKNKISELEKLRKEVTELRSREKGLKTAKKTNNLDVLRVKVKKAMISLLMEKSMTFDSIEKELTKHEMLMSREDLFSIFKEINQEYTVDVDTNSKFGSPSYYIENPSFKSYLVTSIRTLNKNYLDIILTSDWHTYSIEDTSLFRKIDLLLEYCYTHGISTMINLGDFYDYPIDSSINRAQNSIEARKRLEELAQKLPYQKNITHYIMGANHDEILRRYRLDALEILKNMRPDIISLGYYHAILDINGTPFGLHHPDTKFNTLKDYKRGLSNFFFSSKYSKDDMYMNIFGHFHEYKYFPFDGILSCPSLDRDFKQDGAIHMRINFDSSGKIQNVEIIPINIKNSIKKCKRQVYQKKN